MGGTRGPARPGFRSRSIGELILQEAQPRTIRGLGSGSSVFTRIASCEILKVPSSGRTGGPPVPTSQTNPRLAGSAHNAVRAPVNPRQVRVRVVDLQVDVA